METDADRRFRRLAAALAGEATFDAESVLEIDVRARTFTYRVEGDLNQPQMRRVTVLEHVLDLPDGIGAVASQAWGEDLSDEDGWLRLTLSAWDESEVPTGSGGDQWWTFGAGRGIAPVPPWEATDDLPPAVDLGSTEEPIDHPPSRRRPRRCT